MSINWLDTILKSETSHSVSEINYKFCKDDFDQLQVHSNCFSNVTRMKSGMRMPHARDDTTEDVAVCIGNIREAFIRSTCIECTRCVGAIPQSIIGVS